MELQAEGQELHQVLLLLLHLLLLQDLHVLLLHPLLLQDLHLLLLLRQLPRTCLCLHLRLSLSLCGFLHQLHQDLPRLSLLSSPSFAR